MSAAASGHLRKMHVVPGDVVSYHMPLGSSLLPMNEAIGKVVSIRHLGEIQCIHCGRQTKKSFSQGFCYPCFTRLAQCDSCILAPEKCHFDLGTCREPEWAQEHCMVDHIVYLANSSGVKVGITRETQVPTRWLDQGATQALPIMRVKTRQQSGLVEDIFRAHVKDRTDWRAMLKFDAEPVDLASLRDALFERCEARISEVESRFGVHSLQRLEDAATVTFRYPVQNYPQKVVSLNMDKEPLVEGTLLGIKGQYLIFDNGVINIRKYTSYLVEVGIR